MSGFRRPFTVIRRPAGSYVGGRWTEGGAATAVPILASWQPASGKDLEKLPEGRRTGSVYKLFTNTPLIVLGNAEKLNPDQILYNGDYYECTTRADWQNNVINHYMYLFTKAQAIDAGAAP